MNKTKEYILKMQELISIHPECEVMFFVNTEDGSDYTYTSQEISSVTFDSLYSLEEKEKTLIGKDEILEYISEQVYDEELAKASGNCEDVISDEELDIKEKRVLIVDDLVDTGATLKKALEYCSEAKTIKTFTVYYKERSKIQPDYFFKTINNEWINYDYETNQDFEKWFKD